jgi:hypothetical protein
VERTALVTGSANRVADVGDALEKAGFSVTRATDGDGLAAACSAIAPRNLDCYVQLPRETVVHGESLIDRVRQFLAEGLLARFAAAATVAPLLTPEATVVLVAGNLPGASTPDDRHARIDLLRVLARAILAECEESDVRAVVVGYDRTPEEIVEIALKRGKEQHRAAKVAALPPDLNYEDWQKEYLTLTTQEE